MGSAGAQDEFEKEAGSSFWKDDYCCLDPSISESGIKKF